MCSALNVSTSGYYRWKSRKPSRSSLRRHVLAVKIREIHVQFKKIYGYRRVYKSLHKEGKLPTGSKSLRKSLNSLNAFTTVNEFIPPWDISRCTNINCIEIRKNTWIIFLNRYLINLIVIKIEPNIYFKVKQQTKIFNFMAY